MPRPSISEIRMLLEEIRDEDYPTLSLGTTEIEISDRMQKISGKVRRIRDCSEFSFTLILSGPYHDAFGWGNELWQTLKHEIIHIALPYDIHGSRFHAEMRRTGAERHCRTRGRDLVRKAQYRCKACAHIFKSKDRELFCPVCDDLVEQIGIIEE